MKNQFNNIGMLGNYGSLNFKSFISALVLLLSVGFSNLGFSSTHLNQAILTEDTPWMVADNESEAVKRALEDVQRDWYAVFGRLPIVLNKIPDTWRGSVIYFG